MVGGTYTVQWRRRLIKLMVASYNNGTPGWNGEAEETALRTYTIEHSFNKPAKCIITLADPTGAIMRKYNCDANDVYLGVGKITLEDPTDTDIFYGRIKRVTADQATHTTTLECYDWLDQLDDELITYDMREKLSGNIRQSIGHADPDNATEYLIDVAVKTLFSAQADDGGAITDETDEANDDTTDDMTLLPATPAENDAYYFGFETQAASMILNISQTGVWAGTTAWEYWDGDSWEALTKTDPGNSKWDFEVVSGETGYAWTVPGDWATKDVNGVTAYYIRCRVSAYTSITTQPLGERCFAEYWFYDDEMAWANDAYNNMNLVFTVGMAGSNSWKVGPYTHTTTATTGIDTDSFDSDLGELWVDNELGHLIADNDEDFTVDYSFRMYLGHNTPSVFYDDDSMTGARIHLTYFLAIATVEGAVYIRDSGDTKWYDVGILEPMSGSIYQRVTLEIPQEALNDIVDANGLIKVRFDIDYNTAAADLSIRYLKVEIDCFTTPYPTPITIDDTFNPNRLEIATDLTAAATRVWEEIPYCIVKPIHDHLESATGPILGGDTIVTLTAADGNIEDTTGLSTTQFKDKTRLRILQSLATEDSSMFWITLGGSTVTYKKAFGADTMQLTDGSVLDWQSLYDYNTMINSVDVYGARIGDYEIYQQSQNAASILKYLSTKSKVIRNSGLVSDAEASDIGIAIAARENDVSQMVGCTIYGNTATAGHATTIKLGEIVEITSSYLWPNAAKDYIVSKFIYNSEENKTYLTLYPKASTGERTIEFPNPTIENITDEITADKYTPDPLTHEVS